MGVSLESICAAVTFTAAVLVYLNSLPASFAFDDNFAVIYNGDVTNDANPISGLFHNDFWGQNISSAQSHKSFRPLTVLAFRLNRQLWQKLPPAWTQPVESWRVLMQQGLLVDEDSRGGRPRASGLDPLLFHAANVLLHGLASVLVCRLAYYLFHKRAWMVAQAHLASLPGTAPAVTATAAAGDAAAAAAAAATGGGGDDDDDDDDDVIGGNSPPSIRPGSGGWGAGADPSSRGNSRDNTSSIQESNDSNRLAEGGLRRRKAGSAESAFPAPGPALASSAVTPTVLQCQPGKVDQGEAADFMAAVELSQVHVPSCFASLAFALHPVHTEAVAGIVGQAELLCAIFSIPALLLYFKAADGCSTSGPASRGGALSHWVLVVAAVGLSWAAALSKEIGITVLGAMVAYDVLLVPAAAAAAARRQQQQQQEGGGWLRSLLLQCRWARLLVLCLAGLLYVRARSFVAGDQLVRIYRKVENPIAFSTSPVTRALSTLHLHARYALLLLWPRHLSADWSFACVPLVEDPRDPRNALSAALYLSMLVMLLVARPWDVLREWVAAAKQQPRGPPTAALVMRRWRLAVLLGLSVAPFLPAANLFFFVGTFIGERLMYMPSVGFCLLLAEGLAVALGWLQGGRSLAGGAEALSTTARNGRLEVRGTETKVQNNLEVKGTETKVQNNIKAGDTAAKVQNTAAGAQAGQRFRSWLRSRSWLRRLAAPLRTLLLLACLVLLGMYACRTYVRNWDWLSEEALFVSAQQVCWNSSKVQLNSGILERRRRNLPAALNHFTLARTFEPGYCEPDYWVGVTLINMGQSNEGLQELEKALSCKYVAAEALKALNTIYQVMHNSDPSNGLALLRWGKLLLRPELGRQLEGCSTLEHTALNYAQNNDPQTATAALDVCLAALGPSPEHSSLHACISARRPVYVALGTHGPHSKLVKQAAYRYIQYVGQGMPQCRRDGVDGELGKPTAHMQLIHNVQAVDAEDPWLQIEWGEAMLQQGRAREAGLHISVGAMLLAREGQGEGPSVWTSLQGETPLSPFAALEAAAAAYERASQLGVHGIHDSSPCDLKLRAADARMSALGIVPAAAAAGAQPGAAAAAKAAAAAPAGGSKARRQAVARQLQEGLQQLAALPECSSQGQLVAALQQRYAAWQQKQQR